MVQPVSQRSEAMDAVLASGAEERVVLHDVSWETYERLLTDLAERSSLRLTYDDGALEIMSPSEEHEEVNRALAFLVETLITELDLEARSLRSATFRREDLVRGFEPDSCFYIQNVDLKNDPPPDLVIEVDLSSSSLHKQTVYEELRVPEVWRCDGKEVCIYTLIGDRFERSPSSAAFPFLSAAQLTRFLAEAQTNRRSQWLRSIQEWLRSVRGEA